MVVMWGEGWCVLWPTKFFGNALNRNSLESHNVHKHVKGFEKYCFK